MTDLHLDQLHSRLIGLFSQIIRRDNNIVSVILETKSGLSWDGRQLTFTLPQLYKLVTDFDDEFKSIDYPAFRKLLYDNPTNQQTRAHGGNFSIVEDRGHIDNNVYHLMRV